MENCKNCTEEHECEECITCEECGVYLRECECIKEEEKEYTWRVSFLFQGHGKTEQEAKENAIENFWEDMHEWDILPEALGKPETVTDY